MDKRKKKLSEEKEKRDKQRLTKQKYAAEAINKAQSIPEDRIIPLIESLDAACDLANVSVGLREPTREGERRGQSPWEFTRSVLEGFTSRSLADGDAEYGPGLTMEEIQQRGKEAWQRYLANKEEGKDAQLPAPQNFDEIKRIQAELIQEQPKRLTEHIDSILHSFEEEGFSNDLELYWFTQLNYRPIWERAYPDDYALEGYDPDHERMDELIKRRAARIVANDAASRNIYTIRK